MTSQEKFFAECQRILNERRDCRANDRRFFCELGKAWAGQLEIFLASQGIELCRLLKPSEIPSLLTVKDMTGASFPPLPGHLVAAMFAVQKIFRGTLNPDKLDHALDAANYMWISFDERTIDAAKSS